MSKGIKEKKCIKCGELFYSNYDKSDVCPSCFYKVLQKDKDQKIAELEKENKDLEDDHNKLIDQYNKQYNELCEEIKVHSSARERLVEKVRELEKQLENSIVPKFKIGQKVYMIPNEFNGLKTITEYEVLEYVLCSIGVRFHLSIIEKQKGIEQFYCASEDMIGLSIFATKEEAEAKLKELQGD